MIDNPDNITIGDTELAEWFERDRSWVAIYLKSDTARQDPILDIWDDAVQEAFQDGFLKPGRDLHSTAFEWAAEMGRLNPANRVKQETAPTGWIIASEELGVFLSWRDGEMIWSGTADQSDIDRGAYTFSTEESAAEWFAEDTEIKDHAAFLETLNYHEVEMNITVEGHVRHSRVSASQLEACGIDLARPATLSL